MKYYDILKEIDLSDCFIKTLNQKEIDFFISLREYFFSIKEVIKLKYPNIKDDFILVCIRRLSYFDENDDMNHIIYNDFEKDVYSIIKSVIRDSKIQSILNENKIKKLSEFTKLI